jgi:predicted PurR-regulated permease PerM
MLAIDGRAARYTWSVIAVVLLLVLLYLVRTTLFIFILAILLAYLLSPLVNLLDRFLPGSTRAAALALAYLIFVGLLSLFVYAIGSRAVEQATTLSKTLPEMVAAHEQPSPSAPPGVNSLKTEIMQRVRAALSQHSQDLLSYVPAAGVKFLGLASYLIYVVIIPILAFFFLSEGRVIRQHVLELVEAGPRRELLDDLLADVHLLLAQYMRALVLLSIATFTAYSIFFEIARVPYGILLAAFAAVLEFIPLLGPLTAAIVIVIVGAVGGASALAILIFLGCYRVFQDYILSPILMKHGVRIHPLLVLFGVFAGGELAGVPGTFLSVPVLATARIFYVRLLKARRQRRSEPFVPARG